MKRKKEKSQELFLRDLVCAPYVVIPDGQEENHQVFYRKLYDGEKIVFSLVYQSDLGFACVKEGDRLFLTSGAMQNFVSSLSLQAARDPHYVGD